MRQLIRVRVSVGPDGERYIDLPTYQVISGTERGKTVVVAVPDDECEGGDICPYRIRAKYRGQPRWDRADMAERIRKIRS